MSEGNLHLLALRTLGTLDLKDSDGNEIEAILAQPKRYAILAYLALGRPLGLHRRDTILGMFWPEQSEANARNALSQSLSFLRRHLSEDVILGRGTDAVGLSPEAVRTDVAEFETALAEERWEDALTLYGGDFLRGFFLDNARGFGDWVETERERLRELAAAAAWSLAREQIQSGLLVDAERSGQKALGFVWSDETPVREFIGLLAEAGDGSAALRFYEKFRTKLWDELELEPSPATSAVADAIRNGDLTVRVPSPPASAFPGPHQEVMEPPTSAPASATSGASGPWKLWFWSLAGAAIVCFAAVGGLRLWWAIQNVGPPPPDRPFTVLASVGGNASLEKRQAVAALLRNGLDMAHVVQTVPLMEIDRVLELMDREPGTPLSPGMAREVAIRLGVPTVVLPRLDLLGDGHVLSLRVEDVEEGLLRAESRGSCESDPDIVEMVDKVARRLRRDLGEKRAVLANTERLPQVLTPSLEALMRYQAAQSYSSQDEVAESRRLLWEAVTLDPAFAMAWQRLSDAYLSSPLDRDSSGIAAEQVQRHRDRLTAARWADLQLHLRIIEDIALWDVALADAERAVRQDPTWSQYYALRLGHEAGMPDSAWTIYLNLERDRARRHRRFRPDEEYLSSCHSNYLKWSISLGRTREWMSLLDSLGGGLPEDCALDLALGEALANAEWDLAESLLVENDGKWRWPSGIEWNTNQILAVRGRVAAARERLAPPVEDPFGVGQTQRIRLAHLFLTLVFDLVPTPIPEGVEPMELAGRGKFQVVDFLLYGAREGLVGDTLEAQRVARRLQAMRDTATSRTFERNFGPWFALLDSAPAYRRGDWGAVVGHLEPIVSGIRDPGVGGYLPGAAYLTWWMLADAYEGLEKPDTAISYLEAFSPRPVERLDDYTFHGFFRPMARLRLGRLYAQVGNATKAREHLEAFLNTFNDPDPEYEWMVDEAREVLEGLGAPGS